MRGARGDLNRQLEVDIVACELGRRIGQVVWDHQRGVYRGCGGRATCWHELRKRSQGGSITDRSNLMASCARCNQWVEEYPRLAHLAGLVRRRSDLLD